MDMRETKVRKMAAHNHGREVSGGSLKLALALTVVILIVETIAGVASHSLALLADAGHILTDVVALGLGWFAVVQARRPADARRTYGYHRVGILTAMANGMTLIVIVAVIAVEAVNRLRHPEPVAGTIVVASALAAIAVNSFIALRLHEGGEDLNIRAALLHVLGDLGASAGVVVSGLVILMTGFLAADAIVSIAIALLIAWGAFRLVRDTVHILLEGTPATIEIEDVQAAIAGDREVASLHDLHVWSIAPGQVALSAHVVVDPGLNASDAEHLVRRLEQNVCNRFNIGHTTIQVEACCPCEGELRHGAGDHNHPHRRVRAKT